ncbi:nitroreductase family protein [Nonomuraea jiangxiensis]|uniref:SagB-type dehydrogenase domain-containing protein n=1 Tax=Nonomuraea jiangxiensis TaxID=633440 RepID=A0A1G8RZN2_9ACTN|nr:nitroreductase family protein [Nonomuraea jiangxiensis]SDJ22371.1 SagB-type dehydrogenase domain-containing protein [Nonomuraea jiangxiensis]
MTGSTDAVATARRFWHRSLDDYAGLLGSGAGREEPLKAKVYGDAKRYPLPARVPYELGPLSAALCPAAGRDLLTTAGWGRLLRYAYGLSRLHLGPLAMWPLHRTVASARCLFPVELYAWLPGDGERPAGLFYYDPAHHHLVLILEGDWRSGLNATGAGAVFVLTSLFIKTAFRYGDYAYRLCVQEAGLVAGNLLMVAGALGLTGRVSHRFPDAAVQRLLGLTVPGEAPLMIISVGSGSAEPASRTASAAVSDGHVSSLDLRDCPELLALDSASRLPDAARPESPSPGGGPAARPADLPAGRDPDLAEVLAARESGGPVFNSVARPADPAVLRWLAAHADGTHTSDASQGDPLVRNYAVVNALDGVAPGLYRLADGTADLMAAGHLGGPLMRVQPDRPPPINFHSANLVVYVSADPEAAMALFGARSYRILHHEAGIVAQRVSVMCTAHGLTARVHNGYLARPLREALGLPENQTVLFQVVVGTARPTGVYRLPISF